MKAADLSPEVALRWAADCIEADPAAYDQRVIYVTPAGPRRMVEAYDCSTACCIAGWIAALAASVDRTIDPRRDAYGLAGEVLGDDIVYGHGRTAAAHWSLFTPCPQNDWPGPYRSQWRKARTKLMRAQVAAQFMRDLADGTV